MDNKELIQAKVATYELLNEYRLKISDSMADISEEIAALCPIEIGEEVEVNGYTHTGKKMIVSSVGFVHPSKHIRSRPYKLGDKIFRCNGVVLKNDKSLSKFNGDHFC